MEYYKLFNLQPDATHEEIRRRYKELARLYHPDFNGGDKAVEEKFKQLGEAYAVLGDEQKRAQYDKQMGFKGGFGYTQPQQPSQGDENAAWQKSVQSRLEELLNRRLAWLELYFQAVKARRDEDLVRALGVGRDLVKEFYEFAANAREGDLSEWVEASFDEVVDKYNHLVDLFENRRQSPPPPNFAPSQSRGCSAGCGIGCLKIVIFFATFAAAMLVTAWLFGYWLVALPFAFLLALISLAV